MNTVTLTEHEMELAALTGIKRRAESKSRGRGRVDHPAIIDENGWDMDIEGASAEMAFCKFRGEYWTASIGSFKGADHGDNIQIRQTKLNNGCLIIRELDNDDHRYVLVSGKSPTFQMHGWILGKDGKRKEYEKNPGGRSPAYFVPQHKLNQFKPNQK